MDNENDFNDPLFEKIDLTEEEQQIFHKLKECDKKLQNFEFFTNQRDEWMKLNDIGGKLSFDLYSRLTARGIDVRFNKNCFMNRSKDVGGGPELLEFHKHLDVINDLVAFIEFKHVHDDAGDVTLGVECSFDVFCKRRSEPGLPYKTPAFIKRTPKGWWIHYFELNQETNKQCIALLKHIDSQAIIVPKGIELAFEMLWEQAAEGLEVGDFKRELNKISKWIELTESGRPDWF
jgi:hypothetical protein